MWSEMQQTALFSFAFSKFLTWEEKCLLISCWFLLFVCLFVYAVLLVGARRCFQQYNFLRPQFCAVIVCMVQLCLGSFLCTCFSWMAGLSWNVSLPVTKAPSVIGGEGWYIEEAAAFWEVAFHRLPCGVTEGKLFNRCTGGFWGSFFLVLLFSFLFFSFSFFPLKKIMFLQWALAVAPKAAARQAAGREGVSPVSPALLKPCGIARWGGRKALFGCFHGHSWDKDPVAAEGPDPKGTSIHRRSSSGLCGSWVGLEGRLGKMAHRPLHSPSHARAGHVGLQQGQTNGPKRATGVQPHLSWTICKRVGLTFDLDNVIQGWVESHRPWSKG